MTKEPRFSDMSRLLQTLDEDMDPEAFGHDDHVAMIIGDLNDMYAAGPMRELVSVEGAQSHLNRTMVDMMGNPDTMAPAGGMME